METNSQCLLSEKGDNLAEVRERKAPVVGSDWEASRALDSRLSPGAGLCPGTLGNHQIGSDVVFKVVLVLCGD